ncbi:MAG: hypothetical protein LBN39_01760 [Planctomycetaceae bacterium]|jgi:excinuclease ABC subunit A|nr:hypothetical protein [Planctomycetaceae bacterium]
MIQLRGVRTHNLKNIDLDLPAGKLTVFCGRSGSGKTSLAIDTLYAEGQRRYLETFSADARRFLEQQAKPDADRIDGVPAALAVTSKTFSKTSTHTVGTATEITDYLEQLFERIGQHFCPQCGLKIKTDTPQSILFELKQRFQNNERIQVMFPCADLTGWKERGFLRGVMNGEPFRLDEPDAVSKGNRLTPFFIAVDRLTTDADEDRFIDSLETAMDYGQGRCTVLVQKQEQTEPLNFSRQFACANCKDSTTEVDILLAGKTLAQLCSITINELKQFSETLELTGFQRNAGRSPLNNIQRRLEFLTDTGLGYLTLNRSVQTLSGGEQRRIGLTRVLSSDLADMLYVLDEPTLGLHPRDTEPLLNTVKKLRDRDNTVVVVEHNETLINAADNVVVFGPGGGENGGEIVKSEELRVKNEKIENKNHSLSIIHYPLLKITNCRGHNLKNIDISFPLGILCTITGVSGSGKSSLLQDTLYPALCKHLDYRDIPEGLPFDSLTVAETVQDVVLLDDEPVGKTSRSNPATYLKAFDDIRNVFAEQPEAQVHNITIGNFSFNTEGGRCEYCKGTGTLTVEMQFLPNMTVPCSECKGRRFRPEVLEVLYRGRNIAEVLTMTAREAFSFFRGQSKLQKKLKFLLDAGLEYIQLGQPLNTLSGGELQRLKLAAYLAQIKKSRTLIIMDEPAAGLHRDDVAQLLECFRALIQTGHSLIVAEHNVPFIQSSDYVIDLGPGAAENGGRIVVQGTPAEVFAIPKFSHR